jgi:hypothetical protein
LLREITSDLFDLGLKLLVLHEDEVLHSLSLPIVVFFFFIDDIVLEDKDLGSFGCGEQPGEHVLDGDSFDNHFCSELVLHYGRVGLGLFVRATQDGDEQVEEHQTKAVSLNEPNEPNVVDDHTG